MIMSVRRPSLIILLLAVGAGACAPAAPQASRPDDPERARIKKVFAAIDERNATVKKSAAWLAEAYRGLGIRDINVIPPEDYAAYRRFAVNGEVYIIVHPGYFPFFDKWDIPRPPADYSGGYPALNVMERVTADLPPKDVVYRVAREQERITRDFIEFMSEEKRLVVLILPRDYAKNVSYGAVPGYDEYARYLNELTNRGESVVFTESITHDNGQMNDEDLEVLVRFLEAVGTQRTFLGGGFLGKCLDGFFGSLRTRVPFEHIYYVPELTAYSPADMVTDRVNLLTKTGRLSISGMRKYFQSVAYNRSTGEKLRWKFLPLYQVYQNR
jgi:hypothetical protein